MKWEDYRKGENIALSSSYVKINIECPKCGAEIYRDESVVYMAYPPQHDYYCFKCGWKGRK